MAEGDGITPAEREILRKLEEAVEKTVPAGEEPPSFDGSDMRDFHPPAPDDDGSEEAAALKRLAESLGPPEEAQGPQPAQPSQAASNGQGGQDQMQEMAENLEQLNRTATLIQADLQTLSGLLQDRLGEE